MSTIKFAGYASVFNVIDKHKDVIEKGAFDRTIRQLSSDYIDLLWQHSWVQKVGKITKIQEDKYGLYIEGFINTNLPSSELLIAEIKNKKNLYFSIGYFPKSFQKKGNIQYINDIDLVEISFVENPSNIKAKVLNVESIYIDPKIATMLNEIQKIASITCVEKTCIL